MKKDYQIYIGIKNKIKQLHNQVIVLKNIGNNLKNIIKNKYKKNHRYMPNFIDN